MHKQLYSLVFRLLTICAACQAGYCWRPLTNLDIQYVTKYNVSRGIHKVLDLIDPLTNIENETSVCPVQMRRQIQEVSYLFSLCRRLKSAFCWLVGVIS